MPVEDATGPPPEIPWDLRSRRGNLRPERRDGELRLSAEREWLLRGEGGVLDEVAAALPAHAERLGPRTLLLTFGNAVGRVDLPHLGRVEVASGKWGEESFDRMLGELVEIATNLPYSAGDRPLLPFRMSSDPSPRVDYQAFVYLRHVLSESAPRGVRLLPALESVLREPHRRWKRDAHRVPLEAMSRVGPESAASLLSAPLHRPGAGGDAPALGGPLAALAGRLQGHLPDSVVESRVRSDVDTPENRFVRRFLDRSLRILSAAEELGRSRGGAFGARLVREAERCASILDRVRRHPLWKEVGEAHRLPVSSTVLRKRRGYRQIFRHWIRLRRTADLPLDRERATALLELKKISDLYELWCYFKVVEAAERVLGPPLRASRPAATAEEAIIEHEYAVRWKDVRIFYNGRFSRGASRRIRKAYSRPLRPDVVIEDEQGGERVVHLLDAKFRIRRWKREGDDRSERITFKSADLHKMHAYRDAVLAARSAWVLYPGEEYKWYGVGKGESPEGVGAIPLGPGETQDAFTKVMLRLLQ